MTYKNIKFDDSSVMRALEKIAIKKGLAKPEEIKKMASGPTLDLKPTSDLTQNLMKLCAGLRASGYHKYADEVENKFLNLKRAETHLYQTHNEVGEDLVERAHPEGSHALVGVSGDAVVETIVDQDKQIKNVVNKVPNGKLGHKDLMNVLHIILADNQFGLPSTSTDKKPLAMDSTDLEDPSDESTVMSAASIQKLGAYSVFPYNNALSDFGKIEKLLGHDKVPDAVRKGVASYAQFIANISRALSEGFTSTASTAQQIQSKRYESTKDKNSSFLTLSEVSGLLQKTKAAPLNLSSSTYGELKQKLNSVTSQVAQKLETALLPGLKFSDPILEKISAECINYLQDAIQTFNKGI